MATRLDRGELYLEPQAVGSRVVRLLGLAQRTRAFEGFCGAQLFAQGGGGRVDKTADAPGREAPRPQGRCAREGLGGAAPVGRHVSRAGPRATGGG